MIQIILADTLGKVQLDATQCCTYGSYDSAEAEMLSTKHFHPNVKQEVMLGSATECVIELLSYLLLGLTSSSFMPL